MKLECINVNYYANTGVNNSDPVKFNGTANFTQQDRASTVSLSFNNLETIPEYTPGKRYILQLVEDSSPQKGQPPVEDIQNYDSSSASASNSSVVN